VKSWRQLKSLLELSVRIFILASVLALSSCKADAAKQQAAEPFPDRHEETNKAATVKLLLPEKEEILTGKALLDELKKGGYILYFRHFHTDHTKWHEDPIKPKHAEMTVNDFLATCEQQRPLTEFGRRRAKEIGAFIKKHGIPIGKVLSSPYCRVVESATLLAGRGPDDTPYELVHRGGQLTYEIMAKNVRPHLGKIPAAGTNTILMAHRPQMDDIRFIEEGECFVLKPLGDGKFNLVGTIYDSDWYEAEFDIDYLGLRGRQPGGDNPPRGVTK
jgi:phosphohistidine phosphatase SixA